MTASGLDFRYAALDTTACAAFIKESRMKCAEAANCTGNPGGLSLDACFNLFGFFENSRTDGTGPYL
jgi:hypothetical protein